MSAQILDIPKRVTTLKTILSNAEEKKKVDKELKDAKGDWGVALGKLRDGLSEESIKKVELANALADWSGDNVSIVKGLAEAPEVGSLRDVALHFNAEKLAGLVNPKEVPEAIAGETEEQTKRNFAVSLQRKLFAAETSAVLQRMVRDAEVPIAEAELRAGVAKFLANQPDFDIRRTSIYKALKHPEAFKDIASEQRAGVTHQLKTLQRVQALTSAPEAIPVLMKANMTTAFGVAELPESVFLRNFSNALGEGVARQVYTNAINARIRNEQALMTMWEARRGTGLAIIDGNEPREARVARLRAAETEEKEAVPLSLETLFGTMDYCECDECLSLYSPAAYFVELLQYLRNNNLDPENANTGKEGIQGTPLEQLFRRRPDLGCLELTCENTFTVLPYVDLANEIMEHWVVHHEPNKLSFNVEDETTSELLAQPQHTNYQAYCILKDAVYPFTLPYHQPIDSARTLLKYLGTSRYELLDTFRTPTDCAVGTKSPLPDEQQKDPNKLHETILDHAVDAEYLGLTQEEYIHITKEAFWPREYFDITLNKEQEDKDYQKHIGVKDVWEYYGYDQNTDEEQNKGEMLSVDENEKKGLTFVKKQFLPRTGIEYTDLVEMLRTQFINPNMPRGKALAILESIRFSYRFLQSLIDPNGKTQKDRYAKVIECLDFWQPLVPCAEALLHPDPCGKKIIDWCPKPQDFRNWVCCYFEQLGKLIVLESGEGPQLAFEGRFLVVDANWKIHKDGTITDSAGELVGLIGFSTYPGNKSNALARPVTNPDLRPIFENDAYFVQVNDENGTSWGILQNGGLSKNDGKKLAQWLSAEDTCDLEKVRLKHLNGDPVTADEYDRIQRFLRLWRKTGWTIDETDKALVGLGAYSGGDGEQGSSTGECVPIGYDEFSEACSIGEGAGAGGTCGAGGTEEEEWNCPDLPEVPDKITPDFLHQLVAVRKLLDLTGLPLAKLLTFWAEISTAGEKSLYSRLFLTHNLLGIDKVFQADADGNYLTKSEKITDHLPVLMAALRMKADDITAIMAYRDLDNALTLANVSELYRHSLLAKTLHVKTAELADLANLFGEPFKSADGTLTLFENWGRMEDAGFSFRQLNYVVRGQDDPLRPLAPSKRSILQTTKTLYDGFGAIDSEHRDLTADEAELATTELVRTKAGLLFEQSVVEQILGLLEGTSVYTADAPAKLSITIPEELAKKLQYADQPDATSPATLQVTGILTDEEQTQAKGLANNGKWAEAIDRARKQAGRIFDDVLFGVFDNREAAEEALLVGDVVILSAAQLDPTQPDPNTAPSKRLYFLQQFLPFLRRWLAHRLIVETLSGAAGLASDVADILLSDVLQVGASNQSAIVALEEIKAQAGEDSAAWQGYLIPPVDGEYTFVKGDSDTQPAALSLDGEQIAFPNQQKDPNDVWSGDPLKLKGGKLYWLELNGYATSALKWKTATSPTAAIPASALLPDYSAQGTEEVFTKLAKAALLINGFNLSADEVSYWQKHGEDFAGFDFNAVKLEHWLRLQAYAGLRDRLPKTETGLLKLFQWANQPTGSSTLTDTIAAVTLWKPEDIDKLIAPEHFNLSRPEDFRNEINLIKLEQALQVAGKVGVDIDQLFDWANPSSKFWPCHKIAQDIHKALRARYDQEDWEQVVKPLNDQLRENQKNALISYLLVQLDLAGGGVADADSLFEYFLIDVQMDPCFETSRIKQAISSVQLFVQRCLLGLEKDAYKEPLVLDRKRWDWMQRYRVWEANRKVFLYPENWIASQLRDDKSPFYKELESELLQKDIDKQTVEDALKSYLYKVDEVANMRVVGLYVEQNTDASGNVVPDKYIKLHVFARTRNAPYFFYYRYFDIDTGNWYPWDKVQVDIPSYDYEGIFDNLPFIENGAYLIPVVWNRRLLIFLPQFMKKTQPVSHDEKFKEMGENENVESSKPDEYWEIKMGWSEYRNGKWTQKQLSSQPVYDYPNPSKTPPNITSYEFIPRISTIEVTIDVYRDTPALGAFSFTGSQIVKRTEALKSEKENIEALRGRDFHYKQEQIDSMQAIDSSVPALAGAPPYFKDQQTSVSVKISSSDDEIYFYHEFSHRLLSKLTTSGLDDLYEYYQENVLVPEDAFGFDDCGNYHELKRPYSLYNWEAAFHAPMILVERLLESQQFEQALKMCHYIFDPLADGKDDKRFWKFVPFKETDAEKVLEKLFASLQAEEDCAMGAVQEWRDYPFMPHVVARSRPSAYMKWVVMKYLEILIAWGDYLFRQDTIETLNQATQLYVLAAHIYGPRGHKIPKRGKIKPETYNSLLDKWDAFSNAMVELELAAPFSNQTPFPFGVSNGVVGLANIFGFATTLYFCIPDNPNIRALRDTIDDRLFKIRHCQNIEGVFRKLPLFEPPIEPGLLVQAAAQGLSLASVLNDLNSPMPNYRFYYLLQKALELCSEVKALGNAFLSAKEKGDAESISQLRAKHESSIHNLVMEVRKYQLGESQKSLEALQQSRKAPVHRLEHNLKLLGDDLKVVPGADADFNELPNRIGALVDESGFKLNEYEKLEMDKAGEAKDKQKTIGYIETTASGFHAIPLVSTEAMPLGVGVGIGWGGSNLGNAAQAIARYMQIEAGDLSYESTNASRKGGYLRQLQDRVLQANLAGFEIKNIDRQITTQQIRIDIAEQEITNQQKQIDNAQEMEDFLRSKYTNQELYTWMEGQVRTLYYQAYTLAYELAKKAERAYQFERGLKTSNFIQFGYWDAGHDGLFAGERLYGALKRLEVAYQEERGYDFEISRSYSLRQIDPLALIELRETGRCEFTLPEVLFDMDYPGHYMRRIKSVALTVPCVVGPYTSLNCTLRLLEHKFRTSSVAKGKNDYAEKLEETDDRFHTVNVPISAIALSSGQNDSGVFELNFRDERYLPFEGAGAINSKWRIELPGEFRQFDYDTISDVVMHLRYTAVDGGDKLKQVAADVVQQYVKDAEDLSRREGLFAFFDLKQDFSNEWYKAAQPPAEATERLLSLGDLYERLPVFTKGHAPDKILATAIYLFSASPPPASPITLVRADEEFDFADGIEVGTMKSFKNEEISCQMKGWQLRIQDVKTELTKLWLVVKYELK